MEPCPSGLRAPERLQASELSRNYRGGLGPECLRPLCARNTASSGYAPRTPPATTCRSLGRHGEEGVAPWLGRSPPPGEDRSRRRHHPVGRESLEPASSPLSTRCSSDEGSAVRTSSYFLLDFCCSLDYLPPQVPCTVTLGRASYRPKLSASPPSSASSVSFGSTLSRFSTSPCMTEKSSPVRSRWVLPRAARISSSTVAGTASSMPMSRMAKKVCCFSSFPITLSRFLTPELCTAGCT